MRDAAQILEVVGPGNTKANGQLLSLVYQELRRLAAHKLAQEAPGQTLQATALVHEAWGKCFDDVAAQSRTESLRLVTPSDALDLQLTKLKPGRVRPSVGQTAGSRLPSFPARLRG